MQVLGNVVCWCGILGQYGPLPTEWVFGTLVVGRHSGRRAIGGVCHLGDGTLANRSPQTVLSKLPTSTLIPISQNSLRQNLIARLSILNTSTHLHHLRIYHVYIQIEMTDKTGVGWSLAGVAWGRPKIYLGFVYCQFYSPHVNNRFTCHAPKTTVGRQANPYASLFPHIQQQWDLQNTQN